MSSLEVSGYTLERTLITGSPLPEETDYLFIGPELRQVSQPQFGAFVTAGELDSSIGADIVVIDPIGGDDYNGRLYVFHEGTVPSPDIASTPSQADFGDISGDYNENRELPITLMNIGELNLEISSIYLTGSTYLSQANDCPAVLSPQESCTVTITLDPDIAGLYNGTLHVRSNDPDEPVYDVAITANVIAKPDIKLTPASWEFADVPLGTTQSKEITILNQGLSDLHISDISLRYLGSELRYSQANNCPAALPPGGECTATVTYDPVNQVYFTHWAYLNVKSDDPDEPEIEAEFSGWGVPSFISVTSDTLDFGTTGTGSTFAIQNTSDTDTLNWTVTDDLPDWLTLSQMSGEIPHGGTSGNIEVNVDRSGLEAGTYQHTITIISNGGAETILVTMQVPGYLSISPTSLDFMEARKKLTLTISNTSGTNALTWEIADNLPDWLTASQMTGNIPAGNSVTVYLYADRTGLTVEENYNHTLSITSSGGDATVPVSLKVPTPLATFARYYGDNDNSGGGEYFAIIHQTSDGGYITAGLTNSFGNGDDNPWILKLDSSGYIEWEKRYPFYGRVHDVRETSDGGFIVAGQIDLIPAYLWTTKLNEYGDIQWQKQYSLEVEENWHEWGVEFTILQTGDGGYIASGNYWSSGRREDAWVLKLDSVGNIEWQNAYGGNGDDYANRLVKTSDGGYIFTGTIQPEGIDDDNDIWVVKLDSSGNIQWQKAYDSGDYDFGYDIEETSDEGFIIAGTTLSTSSAWVIKIDDNGDIEWQKAYGEDDGVSYYGSYGYSIAISPDGGYILTGSLTRRSGTGDDLWIVRLDENGDILWQKLYVGEDIDVAYHVEPVSDGGFIASGYTTSFRTTQYGNDNYDAFLLKTDNIGNTGSSCGIVEWSEITPVVTSVVPLDTSVTIEVTDAVVYDTTHSLVDTNAAADELCYETEEEVYLRPALDIDVIPRSYDFSYWYGMQVGDSEATIFKIRNIGYDPLTIEGITLTGAPDFSVTDNTCPVAPDTLDAAQQCEVEVTFAPSLEGQQDSLLTIQSNDPDEGTIEVPIAGEGTSGEPPPDEGPGDGGGIIIIPGR